MDLVKALFQFMLIIFSGEAHLSLKKKLLINSGDIYNQFIKKSIAYVFGNECLTA